MNDHSSTRATRATTADAAAGSVLGGRYAVRREIARGGMATVYLAEDTLLNRPVAVKVLTGDADPGSRDSFLQEARSVAKLSHPNIVEVYDAGIEGSLRYIVMQYVPGGTLRDIVAREAPLEPGRAVALTVRVADALNFGHRRGIVHCDMKPGNVLLGDHGEPKIVDFGIARTLTQSADLSELIVGTVGYISPEQVEGGAIDGRTDVYALGAMLYEMLTGTTPYTGDNLATVAAQRLVKPPVPARERNPAVPLALDDAVMRALARDPNDRFPTAKAFADALRAALGGETDMVTRRITAPVGRPLGGATERIPTARPVVVAPAAGGVARHPGRRPWLFIAIAGMLAALAAALLIALAIGLADRGGTAGTATVPSVTGGLVDAAAVRIREAGLRVGSVEVRADSSEVGTVVSQRPEAGAVLRERDGVDLVVSSGPRP